MTKGRASWVMFLAMRLLKALPGDTVGARAKLAGAVNDYLAATLPAKDARDFARTSALSRLKEKD